jgi:hypothetical protein
MTARRLFGADPTGSDQSWDRQLAADLVDEIAQDLDLDAGLREVLAHAQVRNLVRDTAHGLDLDAGLNAIIPVAAPADAVADAQPTVGVSEASAPAPSRVKIRELVEKLTDTTPIQRMMIRRDPKNVRLARDLRSAAGVVDRLDEDRLHLLHVRSSGAPSGSDALAQSLAQAESDLTALIDSWVGTVGDADVLRGSSAARSDGVETVLATARDLARDLAQTLDLARGLAGMLDPGRYRGGDVESELIQLRVPIRDLDLRRVRELVGLPDAAGDSELDRALIRIRNDNQGRRVPLNLDGYNLDFMDQTLDRELDAALVLDRDRDVDRDIGRIRGLIRALEHVLDRVLGDERILDLGRIFHPGHDLGCDFDFGRSLTRAVARVLDSPAGSDDETTIAAQVSANSVSKATRQTVEVVTTHVAAARLALTWLEPQARSEATRHLAAAIDAGQVLRDLAAAVNDYLDADLRAVDFPSVSSLDAVRWSEAGTHWPDSILPYVRSISRELADGVYEIQEGSGVPSSR